MELSRATRITLIITAGVVILGLAAIAMLSGATIELGEIIGALGGGMIGLLSGIGWAGGPSRNRPTEPFPPRRPQVTPTSTVLGLMLFVLPSCGGQFPSPQSPVSTCSWERTAVAATAGAIAALDAATEGRSNDDIDLAIDIAREVVDVGRSAVELCDDAVNRPQWLAWSGDALEALESVVEVLRLAGVRYTDEVAIAISVVQATLASMSTPEQVCPNMKGMCTRSEPPSMSELDHAVIVLELGGER